MSEINKTLLFFALAIGAVALAVFTRPSTSEFNVDEMRGELLFADSVFEGDAARRLRVTSVNQETGDERVFEVTEQNGIWTIPSKSGYPADATEQMGEAVEGLSGKEILQIVSSDSGDHAEFGVADPTDTKATEGQGTRVQLFDDKDKVLADLIIGKEDSDGNFYVRKGGQDHVYLAKVDVASFSSNFRDWIEKDLLDLNPMDVSGVVIDDYTFQVVETREGLVPTGEQRARLELAFDETSSKWIPEKLEEFNSEKKQYVSFELGEDEELNQDALREMKTALDDLAIVDVERKPQGLSADLQAGKEFMTNEEAVRSLYMRGFTPVMEGDKVQLRSTEGEIVCSLKTGVEYVLRFGDLQVDLMGDGEPDSPPQQEGEGDEEQEAAEGVNRYLFVMARLNEEAVEKPELEPLPELPAEGEGDASAPGDDAAGEETSEGDDATETAAEGDDAAAELEKIKQQRETVQKANEQRQKEYQDKLAEGRKTVERLNGRFGDWYYVISNDVFKKVHLGRDEVIRKKSADGAPGADAAGESRSGLPDFGLGADDETATPPVGPPPGETQDEAPSEMPEESAETPATDAPGEEPASPDVSEEPVDSPDEGEPEEEDTPQTEPPGL